MESCGCVRSSLCDACLAQSYGWHAGTAACRGEAWALKVARSIAPHEPWPMTPKARQIAERWVSDLADDARLRVQLGEQVLTYAARRWAQLAIEPARGLPSGYVRRR